MTLSEHDEWQANQDAMRAKKTPHHTPPHHGVKKSDESRHSESASEERKKRWIEDQRDPT